MGILTDSHDAEDERGSVGLHTRMRVSVARLSPWKSKASTSDEQPRVDSPSGEALSLVAHDLRTPLTIIMGYLDLLEQPLDDDQRRQALESARSSARHMNTMVDDLLQTSCSEAILTPSSLRPVAMSDIARETITWFRQAYSRDIRLDAPAEGFTLGEEKRLRQAVLNLIDNAVKNSPDDSTILVSVHCGDGRVICAVEDDGPGIPEAQREMVFERLTRLRSGDGKSPGVGLGLHIVRAIAENHGGRTRVEDAKKGSGSRFILDLKALDGSIETS